MEEGAVIVTGASRGLGAAAARALASLGAPVVIGARTGSDLEAVADDIRARDGRVAAVVGDVTEESVRAKLVEVALQQFGRLRGLVNNAAMLRPIAPLAQAESGAWQAHFQLNLMAPVLLTKLALEPLRSSEGRVINVSSGAAIRVTPGWGAYDLSKAALNHFTRQLAAEEPGLVCVAFRPGVVDTEMQAEIRSTGREAMPPDSYARFVRSFEKGELLPPDRPGRALAMLALWAPHALSGEYISWDDPRVEALGPTLS